MNKSYPFLLLFVLYSLSFPCSASPEQDQLPLPSAIRNLNKQNPELLRLKKLLDSDQIIPFYQGADKILKEANRYRKKDVTPELTEDFAKSLGYASLAAMREAVRAKKMKIHEDAADRAAGQKLLEMAGANLTVAVPEAALDRAADNEMKLLTQRLSRSGISMEQHCKNSRTTADALRAGYRADAERKIRTMYAARAIAEAEGITVRTEEVNNEYRRLSVQQDTPEADIRRVLTPETVAAALVAQKVQRFLLDNAVVASVMDADKE